MNQNPENSQQVVALIKFFSEKEHYLAFKEGRSILRTPHFYRKNEESGRGDRSESCLGYWDKQLRDKIPNLTVNGNSIDIKDAQSVLIYPVHEQQDSWLQSWCVIGPHNAFESSLERILDEFGTYFVILPAENVCLYANLLNQFSGLEVRYGLVQYSDNPLSRSLTVKDSKFSYQKEFRFYIGECEKNETLDKQFNLVGLDNILLEASSLKLESPAG